MHPGIRRDSPVRQHPHQRGPLSGSCPDDFSMISIRRSLALVFWVAASVLSSPLGAQGTGLAGYDLRLFRPPSDGSGVLNIDGSDLLMPGQFRIGLTNDIDHGLLAATNASTGATLRVVDDLWTTNLQAAVGLTRRLQLGGTFSVIPLELGNNFNTGGKFRTGALGDSGVNIKLGLLKEDKAQPGVALLGQMILPTGNDKKFTGGSGMAGEVKLIGDKRVGPFYITGNAGYRSMERRTVVNLIMDDLATFGSALAWTPPIGRGSIDFLAEFNGTVVAPEPDDSTTPIGWLAGIRKRTEGGITFHLAGGRGITDGAGSGEWRIVSGLSLTYPATGPQVKKKILYSGTIPFRFNQSDHLYRYVKLLDKVARLLNASPKACVELRGHTDSEGIEEYNFRLADKRVKSVDRELRRRGITANRIESEAVGEREPVADNRTKEGKSKNRRVDVLLFLCR